MYYIIKILKRIGFWLPILISIIIYENQLNLHAIIGSIVLAMSIIFVSNILKFKKVNLTLEIIGVVLFNFIMFIQITHFYLFNDYIKSSTLYIVFDSNSNETLDFLSMYFDLKVILILTLLIIATTISIYLIINNFKKKEELKFKILSLLLISVLLSNYKIRANTFPHTVYRAIKAYNYEKNKFKEVTYDKFGGEFSEVKHSKSTENEVYVLIIGESTTKNHMSLYNYYRNTNPKLNKLKNELIIYNDVISPHTHTIPSLEKMLTLGSYLSPEKKFDGTLIQLFNNAGFKTYWVSNQKPMGLHETMATIISNSCDENIFVNTSSYKVKSYDEKILNPFKKILKKNINKKFIVIHLMGTHVNYNEQYPSSFEKFNESPRTMHNHKKAFETINAYDNAILYNDYIINAIIEEIRLTNSKSYALYLSDHGEDVYETMDISGHSETKGSKPMYDIPFILWQSEKFKLDNSKYTFDTNRKYSTEDLLYTISDLSNIDFKEFESSRSIVNQKFVPKKRFLSNNTDYDIFFNTKK